MSIFKGFSADGAFGKRKGRELDMAACLRTVPARIDKIESSGIPACVMRLTSMAANKRSESCSAEKRAALCASTVTFKRASKNS
jgi:hypothetical protein